MSDFTLDGFLSKSQEKSQQYYHQELERITSQEYRNAYSLKDDNLTEEQKQLYDVEASKADSLLITEYLASEEGMKLSIGQRRTLKLRRNRNRNFELINEEKSGGDSDVMKDVKSGIKDYENMLREPLDDTPEGVQKQVNRIRNKIDHILEDCNRYLKRGIPFRFWYWDRYFAVRNAKTRLEQEKRIFFDKMKDSTDVYYKYFKDVYKSGDTILDHIDVPKLKERYNLAKSQGGSPLESEESKSKTEETKEGILEADNYEVKTVEEETQDIVKADNYEERLQNVRLQFEEETVGKALQIYAKATDKYVVDQEADLKAHEILKDNYIAIKNIGGEIPTYEHPMNPICERLMQEIGKAIGLDITTDDKDKIKNAMDIAIRRYALGENQAIAVFGLLNGYGDAEAEFNEFIKSKTQYR